MIIKALIHEQYKDKELHVCSHEKDAETEMLLTQLHELFDDQIPCTDTRGDKVKLSPSAIFCFYADGAKVYARARKVTDGSPCETEVYTVSMKLYELEEKLKACGFARISKAEIVNTKKIRKLDLSFTGTIKVIMADGYETFASRRNVVKIKQLLRTESNPLSQR